MLWNLIQQFQLSDAAARDIDLEERVDDLEEELEATRESLHYLTQILESKFGEDLCYLPDRRA